MPSSPSTEPTPLSLCMIVEKWLHEGGYYLYIDHKHFDDASICYILAEDVAFNKIEIGHITPQHVLIYDKLDGETRTLRPIDLNFFKDLAGSLNFAKP